MSGTATILEVPHVVGGRVVHGDELVYESRDRGAPFATPPIDLAAIARPRSEPGPAFDVPVAEIIDFLVATGERLTADNPYLIEARHALAPVSTLPPRVLETSYETLGAFFERDQLEAGVDGDVGVAALDGWRPVDGPRGRRTHVRAFPPRLVHALAGNAPGVAATTVVTGALTKGLHLLKLPSNDLFTATAILRTMAELDPDHPVLRSFSAVYWKGGDATIEGALYRPQFFDRLVAWGGEAAIRHAKQYIGPGFDLVTFDPKASISMIGREAFASPESLSEAVTRAAVDATVFEQDACVSSRFQYVEGDAEQVDRYCELLVGALGIERPLASTGSRPTPPDIREEVDVLRDLEPDYRVWGDHSGRGLVVRSYEPVDFHPDGRTVNVVAVDRLADAAGFANVATQTVGVYPPSRKAELRDQVAGRGVQRVVELGHAADVPPGVPYDGMYVLSRLMRWVTDEGAP